MSGNIVEDSKSLAKSYDAINLPTGSFFTGGIIDRDRNNKSLNLNYRHRLDTTGSTLVIDLDYARFNALDLQQYLTNYFDASGVTNKNDYALLGDLGGLLSIKSFKADYTKNLSATGIKLETGIKGSWVNSDNDIKFFDRSNGGDVLDLDKSNRFLYKENINAAYLNLSKSWKKLNFQLGLRLENTNTKGVQKYSKAKLDRQYTQLFPSGYVGYTFNAQHELGLSVSRRINRPSYRQLNPFKEFLDPLTSSEGNPNLNPELSNSFELTHTLHQKYMIKVGYSLTKGSILDILSPDVLPNSVIQKERNLGRYDYYDLSLSLPFKVGKWLSNHTNIITYYGKYSGELLGSNVNLSRITYNINTSNNIKVAKNTNLEIRGQYQSKSYYGVLDISSNWSVDVGASQQFWNKRASIKLNFSDIFLTSPIKAHTLINGYEEFFNQKRDSRVGSVTFSYRFGGSKESAPKRSSGADEEKRRAG